MQRRYQCRKLLMHDTRIQELERVKRNQKQVMKLIAYLAGDPLYWDFIDKGRIPPPDDGESGIFGVPTDESEISRIIPDQILTYLDHIDDSKKTRWDESPSILGAYLDAEGRNVLQVAIQHGHEKIVEIIESMASGNNPILPSWLLSGFEEKTKNTILHFAAVETVKENSPAIQMQYELQWFERVKGLVPKELEYSRNEEERTALELFTEKHKNMVQNGKEQLMEIGKTCSSLVAAVVFASSFSIPGEKDAIGNPIFLHKTAFKSARLPPLATYKVLFC
ncbi:putative Ankyrin repeat-containing protein [Cocos nucifera]|uniref:Putative Ankyrin repeat-containing protein n=1 Tax=Cocos nucifera TaxID=13894 RepID=A0A8K0N442_COCNU|nr:putative Ankyrin repeat-containing protein [Cocos nucifera]